MTTTEASPSIIFDDARRMHGAALARMADDDIRDAAEKAWCATLRATEALVLARTGQPSHARPMSPVPSGPSPRPTRQCTACSPGTSSDKRPCTALAFTPAGASL